MKFQTELQRIYKIQILVQLVIHVFSASRCISEDEHAIGNDSKLGLETEAAFRSSNSHMLKSRIAFLVALVPLGIISGCGGSGGSQFKNFEGNWFGSYQILNGSSVESSGNFDLTIDQFGNAFGELIRTDQNQPSVNIRSAFMTNSNELRFVFNYVNTQDRQVIGTIERNGNFLEDVGQGLNVSFAGGGTGKLQMTLTRQN